MAALEILLSMHSQEPGGEPGSDIAWASAAEEAGGSLAELGIESRSLILLCLSLPPFARGTVTIPTERLNESYVAKCFCSLDCMVPDQCKACSCSQAVAAFKSVLLFDMLAPVNSKFLVPKSSNNEL